MRKAVVILKLIFAGILGFVLQLFFHEAGHAIFALITGNRVIGLNFGVVPYAEIQILERWSIWIISIASFVFPIIMCLVFELFRGEFMRILTAMILTITTIQLGINSVAVILLEDFYELKTYDCSNFERLDDT